MKTFSDTYKYLIEKIDIFDNYNYSGSDGKKWCHSNDGFLKFVYITNDVIIVTCKEFLKSIRKGQAKRIMDRVQLTVPKQ